MTVTTPRHRNWSGIIVGLVLTWAILSALTISVLGYHAEAMGTAPAAASGSACPF